MGFRDFYGFNLAMLGKQGWKLLTNHDAIISRVFKAKYYPKAGFLEAILGHNPSYMWRSIHASQVVVKGGMRWRIGDGSNINVWSQLWLKDSEYPFIVSTPITGMEDMRVSDLIDLGRKEWREDMVRTIFQPQDAAAILKMPLYRIHDQDALVWRLSRDGSFSVKSAYHYLMESVVDSQHLRVPSSWKELWHLKFPENVWHVFFGCEHVKGVWLEAGLWGVLSPLVDVAEGFSELVFKWKRNNVVWENTSRSSFEIVRRAYDSLEEWQQARSRQQGNRNQLHNVTQDKWLRPEVRSLKCNVDVAMFAEQNKYGIGMCLRNDRGEFVKACTLLLLGSPSVLEAEAQGLLEALSWLHEMNVPNITIELDFLSVVEGMSGNRSISTEFERILVNCKEVWNLSNNFGISFVRRQANRVAHSLARASRFYASHQVFDYMSPCIVDDI